MLLTMSYSEFVYLITPEEPLKSRFWDNIQICFLYSLKQQQQHIFTACCWQYYIRYQHTQFSLYNYWNHVLGLFWNLFTFLVLNNNKYLSHVIGNIIFEISVPDHLCTRSSETGGMGDSSPP